MGRKRINDKGERTSMLIYEDTLTKLDKLRLAKEEPYYKVIERLITLSQTGELFIKKEEDKYGEN